MANTFSNLQSILKNGGTSTVAWVGEAGGAYNSGHHLVSDSFVFSFWWAKLQQNFLDDDDDDNHSCNRVYNVAILIIS